MARLRPLPASQLGPLWFRQDMILRIASVQNEKQEKAHSEVHGKKLHASTLNSRAARSIIGIFTVTQMESRNELDSLHRLLVYATAVTLRATKSGMMNFGAVMGNSFG